MNITRSANKEMLERSWECAARRGMSLNGMFRDFLQRVVAEPSREDAAKDFARLVHAGVRVYSPFALGLAP